MSSQTGLGRLHLVARSRQANVVLRQGAAAAGVSAAAAEDLPEGYGKGFDAGRLQALAELQPRLHTLEAENTRIAHQLPEALANCLTALRTQAREEVVRLALLIAEALLRSEPCRVALLRAAVDEAMDLLGPAGSMRLRLHPDDAALLLPPDRSPLPADIAIVPDPSLKPGDAVLETADRGMVVAGLPARLDALSAKLTAKLATMRDA